MNKQTKLVLERSIFFTFVFVCFGLIIINEKQDLFITNRVEKKLNRSLTVEQIINPTFT